LGVIFHHHAGVLSGFSRHREILSILQLENHYQFVVCV
jgi:hypothetical protein